MTETRTRGTEQNREREFNDRLAKTISEYWKARGFNIHSEGRLGSVFVNKYRTTPGYVKTNMKNGMPQQGSKI
jgi:hypothetical protein